MKKTLNINLPLNQKSEIQKKEDQRKRAFNGLCATEWSQLSKSVWNDVSSTRQKKHLNHGATYPEKLCDRLIKMYSKKGDYILDPFLGTGTTIISALKNERNSIGIELTDRFFNVAKQEMLTQIENTGRFRLADTNIQTHNKRSINTAEAFAKASGVIMEFAGNDLKINLDELETQMK